MLRALCLALVLSPACFAQDWIDLPIPPPKLLKELGPTKSGPPNLDGGGGDDDGEKDNDDEVPIHFFGETVYTSGSMVFVLDVSGSMRGPKLDQARRAVFNAIDSMEEHNEFTVIAYDSGIDWWNQELVKATSTNKVKAKSWLGMINARNNTATGWAVMAAASVNPDLIFLATDGAPNPGTYEEHRALVRGCSPPPVNVVGIEVSGPTRAFCRGVAADTGGFYVDWVPAG